MTSRGRPWGALGTCLVLGALAGMAPGYPEPGWVRAAIAGAVVGGSAAVVALLGRRIDAGTALTGLAAGIVAGFEGLLVAAVAARDDTERADALLGTTLLAVVLGLVCAGVATVLTDDTDPA